MCGIIGMFAFDTGSNKKEYVNRRESMLYLFTEILQNTRTRGPDATGVSALFNNGDTILQKGNIVSPEFISNYGGDDDTYDGFINNCRNNAASLRVMLGHCRKSSVGNTWDNENNHPIKAGEIVGIHNGTLKNHEIVFKKLGCKRDGEVDSEAIMRLVQHLTNDCTEPFTIEMLEQTYCRLEGAYTVICYNANNPYQVALIRKERPMEIALIKSLRMMVVVSEKVFLNDAIYAYNKQAMLYGSSFELIDDDDIEVLTMPLDNVGVVDLTIEVTDKTSISDLLTKTDAFKVPKLWREPVKSSYVNTPHQNWQSPKHNPSNTALPGITKALTTTIIPKNTGSASKNTADEFTGKVFCKDLNRYVDPAKTESLSDVGPVLLNSTSGEIVKEDGKAVESNSPVGKEVVKSNGTVKATDTPLVQNNVKIEIVEPTEDPEILKAAKEETNGLTRYDSPDELVKDLGATSIETLRALPEYALANRIKAHIYEKAFIDGANFYRKLQNNFGAEKAIRVAKHVVTIFGKIIEVLSSKESINYKDALKTEITCMNTTELTKESIGYVFSKGNLMKNNPLATLQEVAKD